MNTNNRKRSDLIISSRVLYGFWQKAVQRLISEATKDAVNNNQKVNLHTPEIESAKAKKGSYYDEWMRHQRAFALGL